MFDGLGTPLTITQFTLDGKTVDNSVDAKQIHKLPFSGRAQLTGSLN
jgi:hypothetical protein